MNEVPAISIAAVPTGEFTFIYAATHLLDSSLVLSLYALLRMTQTAFMLLVRRRSCI
jgi:hypothetical protein